MSIQSIAWVLEHSVSEGYDRLVLLAIANHSDARGLNAFPSVDQIAKEARVGRSTVFRSIHNLSTVGELEVVARGGGRSKSNHYRLPMKPSQSETLWNPETVPGTELNGPADASKRSRSGTRTKSNQEQPSRARAREDRPAAGPNGPPGSGSSQPPEWTGGPEDVVPANRVENLARVRSLRRGLHPTAKKDPDIKSTSEEAS